MGWRSARQRRMWNFLRLHERQKTAGPIVSCIEGTKSRCVLEYWSFCRLEYAMVPLNWEVILDKMQIQERRWPSKMVQNMSLISTNNHSLVRSSLKLLTGTGVVALSIWAVGLLSPQTQIRPCLSYIGRRKSQKTFASDVSKRLSFICCWWVWQNMDKLASDTSF